MAPRTQAERSASTITELLAHARDLFASQGYAGTGIEDIVAAAGVTRGALYHHFDGKLALFRAVFAEVQRELAEHTAAVARRSRGGPLRKLEAGCLAFVDACADPGVQRIFLEDGYAVLGWHEVRQLEADHTLAQLRFAVDQAMKAGEIEPRPVEPLVAMLFGGLCDAVMLVARSDPPERTRREVVAEIRRTFAALRRP
jgi:AcrR family transcriptional regulator